MILEILGTAGHVVLRYVHIVGGMLALASGAGAMLYRKGSPMHEQHGRLFFGSMMAMGSTGIFISVFITPNSANVMGGMMAVYLTFTAWLTAWREPGKTGRLEWVGAAWGLATVVTGVTLGLSDTRQFEGPSPDMADPFYFVMAAIAAFGTMLDVRVILRGGLTGAPRLARHIWRICFALLMATGSFFSGQARLFPPSIRESGVLTLLSLLPLPLLLFWLIKVRVWPLLKRLRRRSVSQPQVDSQRTAA